MRGRTTANGGTAPSGAYQSLRETGFDGVARLQAGGVEQAGKFGEQGGGLGWRVAGHRGGGEGEEQGEEQEQGR
ncbi:hypothetical protein ACU4GD_24725 [Cupriavidus basilensis]